MKQEDKELLFKDLCTRLPYGIICNTPKGDGHLCSINQTIFGTEYGVNIQATKRNYFNDREEIIKPYLRPMNSMTKEEKNEYDSFFNLDYGYMDAGAVFDVIDWINAHYFDYRDLIEKGLAIAVTEENNPYKE